MTLELTDLVKRFGTKTAVDVPHYAIQPGESVGLVGSNGAGKTTLLRLLLDLYRPDQGSVQLNGLDVSLDHGWKRHLGAFLDESFLIDFLTADEYFAFVGSVYGLSQAEISVALERYQSFYPDEPFGKTKKLIRELSKGNTKKIGIIAAMMVSPRLLILDEPFANLDPPSQIQLKTLLVDLNRRQETTMIVSSHDLGHVTNVCSRITVLEQGQIVRDVTTSEATHQELEHYFEQVAL